jgi:hypothetical protein
MDLSWRLLLSHVYSCTSTTVVIVTLWSVSPGVSLVAHVLIVTSQRRLEYQELKERKRNRHSRCRVAAFPTSNLHPSQPALAEPRDQLGRKACWHSQVFLELHSVHVWVCKFPVCEALLIVLTPKEALIQPFVLVMLASALIFWLLPQPCTAAGLFALHWPFLADKLGQSRHSFWD